MRPLIHELVAVAGLFAMLWYPRSAVYYPAISAVASTFLIAVIGFSGGPVSGFLERPQLRFLGGLTYCAYLFHPYAVLAAWVAVRRLGLSPMPSAELRSIIAVPVTAAIAYACRATFETRFLRMKERFARTVPAEGRTAA